MPFDLLSHDPKIKVKSKRTIFMDDGELESAKQNRQRQIVAYPDMKELTDDSKEAFRHKKQIPIYNPQTHKFKFV